MAFVSTFVCWKLQSENTDISYPKDGGIFLFPSEYFVEVKNVYIKDSHPDLRSLIGKALPQQRNRRVSLSLAIFTLLLVREFLIQRVHEMNTNLLIVVLYAWELCSVCFYIHGSVHRNSILIGSNKMQQYVGIYLLPNHSTCFGCPSHQLS